MPIKNWNTQPLKNEILTHLEKTGAQVGQFVQADASRRLLRISDPRWGRRYRASLALGRMRYEVIRTFSDVEIRVGVLVSETSRHHGFYLEIGSHTHGPSPYLRPAVFQNGAKIVALLEGKR